MRMKEGYAEVDRSPSSSPVSSCGTGCGGKGLCPGIAWGVGGSMAFLSGHEWLGWSVGIPLVIVLTTGVWSWRPHRRELAKQAAPSEKEI